MNWLKTSLKIALPAYIISLILFLMPLPYDVRLNALCSCIFSSCITTIVIYMFDKNNNNNPHLFVTKMVVSIMLKLFGGAAFIFLYKIVVQPTTNYFVFPFLLMYLYFTIFTTQHIAKVVK